MTDRDSLLGKDRVAAQRIRGLLDAAFPGAVIEVVETFTPYLAVEKERFRDVMRHLFENGFTSLICLSGVDTKDRKFSSRPVPPDAPRGTKADPAELEIAVVYHLESLEQREKIAIRVSLDREAPAISSVSDIWKIANWHEREAYDMFGIKFEGHPELTRILCGDDWVGHPLLKDYQFPKQYHGIPHARRPSGGELADEKRRGKPGS